MGNTTMDFPITKVENVEGFEESVDQQVNSKVKQWGHGEPTELSSMTIEGLRNKILEYAKSESRNTFLVSMDDTWMNKWNLEIPTSAFGYGHTWRVTITERASDSYFSYEISTYFMTESIDNVRVQWRGSYWDGIWSKVLRYALHDKLSMPSSNSIDVSVAVGANQYTAPADGWLCISFEGKVNGICQIWNVISGVITMDMPTNVGYWGSSLPCAKGDFLQIMVPNATSKRAFFVYAQSEV